MTHRFLIAALASMLSAAATGAAPAPGAPAELVLRNGIVHTQDASRRTAQALALRGRTIIAVGSDADVAAMTGPDTRVVNLGGRTVLPGIIDAHTHPAQSAQDLGKCNVEDRSLTPAELTAFVRDCLRSNPGDPSLWFEVINVNASALILSRDDLDAMLGDRPLLLESADGHTVWANSRALAGARIDAHTADPAGGRIEHDPSGQPTGTLRDDAENLALDAKPSPGLEVAAAKLGQAFDMMHACGITSVQDADDNDSYLRIYRALYDTHRLTMRVRATYTLQNLRDPPQALIARAIEFRRRWAIDPDFLRVGGVKIFADGVIEYPSQTAALLEPYLDAHGQPTNNRGPHYFTQANLDQIVRRADAAGFTVHVHAIGDRAVRAALDAIAYSRRHNAHTDNRDQIAHLELIDPRDVPRFRELGVIANFQLLWARRDDYVVNGTLAYLGPERSGRLYPARAVRDAGGLIAGGSDWGVSSFNPFAAMEHAITRAEHRGQEPLAPDQGLTIADIVDAYTINAAYALKQERTTGSLEAGKRADLIVLDRDPFAVDPYTLHDTRVLATYVDGREVFRAAGFWPGAGAGAAQAPGNNASALRQ